MQIQHSGGLRRAHAPADGQQNVKILRPVPTTPRCSSQASTVARAHAGRPDPPVVVIGRQKTSYKNANFPTDTEGRTYHLGTKEGEVAPRILSVGSVGRAQLLATLLEAPAPGKELFQRTSNRGFLTITGRYEGQPVSIVSTHMGMPNMDFVVRENRAVVRGQMAIVRLGTCGAVQRPAKLGDLLIATHGSVGIRRDPDYWTLLHEAEAAGQPFPNGIGNGSGNGNGSGGPSYSYGSGAMAGRKPYAVSLPVPADADLAGLLAEEAAAVVGAARVVQGLNASADSFYSSQGRTGSDFDDSNVSLLGELAAAHPDLVSLEMETFQLLDLARCSRGSIKAAGMCVALAERYSNAFLDVSLLEELEIAGGTAALRALARCPLEGGATPAASMAEEPGVAEVVYVWE